MIDKHMDREVYYENNNVLDMKDYRRMINSIQNTPENKLSKVSCIRKIYFNDEINYLEDDLDTSAVDKDVYSIVMIDFDTEHLMVERKSRRSGLISKDYAPITLNECLKIFRGDVRWLKESIYPMLNNLYLEITINLRTIGVVVDYERQRFRVNHTNDYIEFDLSVKSIYGRRGDLLSDTLVMKERLDSKHVIMTYKQSANIPPMFKSVLALTPTAE
ncbi:MAG: hypothetical protein EOM34_06870 [Clostridia bacterium]|nr:hypothetical protein [Lachnospiraceae bacterium]NCC00388.1 hypothetical protein [Clostridia bacterium]NCD02587.1 hypothetical protein [Clostridia bacterium]